MILTSKLPVAAAGLPMCRLKGKARWQSPLFSVSPVPVKSICMAHTKHVVSRVVQNPSR